MSRDSIKFNEVFVDSIREEDKYQTIRYNRSDEQVPEIGSHIDAVSKQKGDTFATLEIKEVQDMSLDECVKQDFSGHKNYNSIEQIYSELSKYYDDISRDSSVKVILFDIVEWHRSSNSG